MSFKLMPDNSSVLFRESLTLPLTIESIFKFSADSSLTPTL